MHFRGNTRLTTKCFYYFVLFSLLCAVTARAEEKEDKLYELSAKAKYDFIDYFHDGDLKQSLLWNELSLFPKVKLAPPIGNTSLVAEGLLRKNFDYEGRSLYTLKEGYASLYLGNLDLKLGKQIIKWGVSDEIKPTDYFSRYDYTDLLRKEEEGLFALRVGSKIGGANIDLVFAPVFDKDRLSYDQKNPWAVVPRRGLSVAVNDQYEPKDNLVSSQIGIRVGFEQSGMDYSFVYVYGIDVLPTYFQTRVCGISNGQPVVEVTPHYERIHILGGDFNKPFSTWNLKGEAALVVTEHREISPYFNGVLGAERNFSQFWGNTELFAQVQYAINQFTGKGEGFVKTQGLNFNHLYEHAATINFDLKISESYSAHLKGIFELEQGGGMIQSELRYKPRDSWVMYLGADSVFGKDNTYFGMYRHNDRFLAGIRVDI